MTNAEIAFTDVKEELNNLRRVIERVPNKLDWRPHEKSGTLGTLAQHVAGLPRMFERVATSDEVDLAKWQRPPQAGTPEEILKLCDESIVAALNALAGLSDEDLQKNWTLRMGEHVIFSRPRYAVLRTFAISHIVHHRAQLTVYLRLLNVPVPGLYGPSADEQ